MRKKELRARDEHFRRELAEAHHLASSQVKRLNALRMEMAFLERELELAASRTEHDEAHAGGAEPSARLAHRSDLKACPDCAENVRSGARKCRYCGYRFDGVELAWGDRGSNDEHSSGSGSVARLGTAPGS